tara:strand:- start:97 stop:1050 length:954 start_codon:yes stop_codon:yes gene_type:complete
MSNTFFEILRPGINTTIQDNGRDHLYHIGITVSGAMDKRNYRIANALVENKTDLAVLEFAYQGPLLKLKNGTISFAITGDVIFNIIRNNSKSEEGKCYQNYILNNEEQIDIITTKNSVYGYLSINGGFQIEKVWDSYSINTKAEIGPNNGKKFSINEKIVINNSKIELFKEKKTDHINFYDQVIRVIKATNFDYFSENSKIKFFEEEYLVTKLVDRMGMRLEGFKLENNISSNIKSEGLLPGVIQVPADGNPIIMLSDHGSIGGYPKIAVVASADYDKLVQKIPNSKIKFKNIDLDEAEELFTNYQSKTLDIINKIK